MLALELLPTVLVFPVLLRAIFTRRARPRWMDFLPLLAVLACVVDYRLETNPWRMFPGYLLVGLVFLFTLGRLLRPSEESARHPVWSFIGAFLGLAFLLVAVAIPLLLPMKSVPPTGPLSVGTVTYAWEDPSRFETYSSDLTQSRSLVVEFWYPQDGEDLTGAVSASQPAYPVVIFSHGGLGLRLSNASTYRELASHGYIVASLDHTYMSLATLFPDGKVVLISQRYQELLQRALDGDPSADPEMRKVLETRVADVRFVLDQLQSVNQAGSGSILAGRMDLNQVGLFGHSIGGATAGQVCRLDSRCKAMLDIDGTLSGDIVAQDQFTQTAFAQPIMFINSGNLFHDPTYEAGYAPNKSAFQLATQPAYNLVIAGAEHLNMTDLPLVVSPQLLPLFGERQALAGSISPERSVRIVSAYTLAFFDRFLKSQASPLLTAPSPDYPEVDFEVKN